MTHRDILITIAFSILSIILTALITRHYSIRRYLNIVITSLFDVININPKRKWIIEVLYNKIPIESLWVLRVVFKNSGNFDIEKNMVRLPPRLFLGERVKIIDIEAIKKDEINNIESSIINESSVEFNINFIQRRKMAAFQIFINTPRGVEFKADDIRLEQGVIEDTNINLLKFTTPLFAFPFEHLTSFMFKNRKSIIILYIIISLLLILTGIIGIFKAELLPFKCSPILSIGLILYGFFILIPTLFVLRRIRYREVFQKQNDT